MTRMYYIKLNFFIFVCLVGGIQRSALCMNNFQIQEKKDVKSNPMSYNNFGRNSLAIKNAVGLAAISLLPVAQATILAVNGTDESYTTGGASKNLQMALGIWAGAFIGIGGSVLGSFYLYEHITDRRVLNERIERETSFEISSTSDDSSVDSDSDAVHFVNLTE